VRHVYRADLMCEQYLYSTDTKPSFVFKVTPRKAWVDAEGYVYYQVHYQPVEGPTTQGGAGLMRVDKLGKVHEVDWIVAVPEEGAVSEWAYKQLERIDPEIRTKLRDAAVHWVYYRK